MDSYWVVFYDQYGNELQREALKYGSVPEYKGKLPVGFKSWDKDLKAITGNKYIHAICEEVKNYSSNEGSNSSPTIDSIGDLYFIEDGPNIGSYSFYVFKYNGSSFVFDRIDLDPLNNQPSGDPVVKDNWYHLDNGYMVECTDPEHHGTYIPMPMNMVLNTASDPYTLFKWKHQFAGYQCKVADNYLIFTGATQDESVSVYKYLNKSGNNWIYEDDDVTITFAMSEGVLSFIYVSSTSTGWQDYTGFYISY